MKTRYISMLALGLLVSFSACDNDDDNDSTPVVVYAQEDQVGRPAINTVFVGADKKDAFNTTVPSAQGAAFGSSFETKLLALNSEYTTNLLGLSASAFTGVLATDVLTVSLNSPTTFYDGTNVLTGRTLDNDVIDIELILIFGGPEATSNPGLTSDNVDVNDKEFSMTFPYMATPH